MIKTVLGVILFVWGLGGLIANIVIIVSYAVWSPTLLINSLVCLLFIYIGVRLYKSGRQRKYPASKAPKTYRGIYH